MFCLFITVFEIKNWKTPIDTFVSVRMAQVAVFLALLCLSIFCNSIKNELVLEKEQ